MNKKSQPAQAKFKISGLVQGVFYRAHARNKAGKLGLCGTIRNMPDGSVEATLQGSKEMLLKFKEWAQRGSPDSRVENVEMEWEKFSATRTYIDIKTY